MRRKTAMRKVFKKSPRIPSEFLYGADSLVEYSFVVHNSLTYLDLSRCELSRFKKEQRRKKMYDKFYRKKVTADYFVYTEESCRKRLAPNRKVLYDFHLDVSRDLELSLRNPEPGKLTICYSESILLNRVVVFEREMCEAYLNRMIQDALEQTNEKVKLIRHLSKLARYLKFISTNKRIRDKGLTFLCFQRADSAVVMDFLTVMDFDIDNLFTYSVHIFEFVLYHANRSGYKLWAAPSCHDPIHTAISYRMFVKTESLFQHIDAPRFCGLLYEILQDGQRWSLPEDALKLPQGNGLVTKERHLLILQVLRVFWTEPSTGLKALQMLWRSIPDPFINSDELALSLSRLPNPGLLEHMTRFMKDITGEDVLEESGHRPRKLKQYCRTVIRGVLSNNRQLLEGIGELQFPPSLKSYLRLET